MTKEDLIAQYAVNTFLWTPENECPALIASLIAGEPLVIKNGDIWAPFRAFSNYKIAEMILEEYENLKILLQRIDEVS